MRTRWRQFWLHVSEHAGRGRVMVEVPEGIERLSAAQWQAAEAQRRVRRRQLRVAQTRTEGSAVHRGLQPQPAPVSATQKAGAAAEERAWQYLQAQGCCLLARNLRCRAGEVDLIVWDGRCLVFVEVRWRRDSRALHGGALASVDWRKQQRLQRTAQFFLSRRFRGRQALPPCRFDVVAIDDERIHWVRAAFD